MNHSSLAGVAPITLCRPWRKLRQFLSAILLLIPVFPALAGADQATRLTLDNGLEVVVIEDRRAPIVIQMLLYRSGSMDESNGRTGVAHLLEHLMFKGTPSFPEGRFSEIVAAAGGRENAFTSRDFTGYYQQFPVHLLRSAMTMEADRMQHLRFDEQGFNKELAVVMEERRSRIEDQPSGKLSEQLMAVSYLASPYRNPVIGWMNDLKSMSADDARDWYSTRYAPNNAILVIAGDVSVDQVLRLARETYGTIARKALPVLKPQVEPRQLGMRRAQVKAPAESESVRVAYKVPALRQIDNGADQFALSMLAAVLSSSDTGRLTRDLVRTSRLANRAWASYSMVTRGPVLFMLGGTPATGQTAAQLETALIEQVRKIAREGVNDDELTRIKARYIASQVYEKDSLFSQVMEAGTLLVAGFEVGDADRILDGVRAITASDVKRVAAKYFDPDQSTVVTLIPESAAKNSGQPTTKKSGGNDQ